jgi:ATP-independent RNA helicase DbpA
MTTTHPTTGGPQAQADTHGFATLALSPRLHADDAIQAAALPPALLGKDLIAQAKTGSGKTAAFALALLANLNPRRFAVQALVLCPTRELADQVTPRSAGWPAPKTTSRWSRWRRRAAARADQPALEHGAHIVVGTPGRVMDHLDAATSSSTRSTRWCWTKPTACWTWASSTTW